MSSENFSGIFSTIGDSGQKKIPGVFQAVIEETDAKIILNPSEYSLMPVAVTGIIKNKINGVEVPIPNARVSFFKDYVVAGKTNKQYAGTLTVLDWCITDQTGKYVVFVEPGEYTIRVDNGKHSEYYTSQVVPHGLNNEYYYTIQALIKSRCEDTLSFYGTDKRLIQGIMVDAWGKPENNAEIIVTRGEEIFAYQKTKENGRYAFAIENGIYDVRLRSPRQSVTITRKFNFEDGKGFFTANQRTIQML